MRCWHGYLSGARCTWFACGPADATATPSSFASLKSIWCLADTCGLTVLQFVICYGFNTSLETKLKNMLLLIEARVGPEAVSKWVRVLVSKWATYLWSAKKTRIGPLHFQAGCRRRQLNLALVFCVFILCCSTFLLAWYGKTKHNTTKAHIHQSSDWLGECLWNNLFCVEWDA